MTRAGLVLVMALATMGVGYPALTPMPIKLLWNASASAPIGLYTIDFDGPFDVTDLVAVDAPEPLAAFMAERGYLPRGVPLLKRVLGVSGQTVCRSNLTITVDGVEMGKAHSNHMADQGSDEYQYETTIKFANTEGRYLYNIEEALSRIEDGSYGKCTECGGNIGIPRLTRLPYTRMCIECKEKEEAGTL